MASRDPSNTSARRFSDGVSLSELVHYLREGVYIMDASGVVLDANPVAMDLLGVADIAGSRREPVLDRLRSVELWHAEMQALARDGVVREFTREVERADGSVRTLLDTCYARVDDGVITYHGVVIDVSVTPARDVSDRTDSHTRDAATGAYTADYLDLLNSELQQRVDSRVGVCVVHMPQDDLSESVEQRALLNTRLERMARFLLRHIRSSEVIVRAAPDLLVVVLPDADDRAAEIVARRLQLAALRSAPSPFRLGWAARRDNGSVQQTVTAAMASAVPVHVVERSFEPARQR